MVPRSKLPQVCALSACLALAACGKDTRPASSSDTPEPELATTGTGGSERPGATEANDQVDRLELGAEFHRTRSATGTGFWVLGVVHNPFPHPVTDVQLQVEMRDAVDHLVAQTDAPLGRRLEPDERAAVAVLVADPVVHEQLVLTATALTTEDPAADPLPLKLEHQPPQRADVGGWYVIGTVENTGETPFEGARIEIHGLDRTGKLVGIDWLDLPVIEAKERFEFDVGDLRYEEVPAKFWLELRGP